MKQPALSKDLVSVADFRAGLADWVRRLGENGRPVVLTQRGRAAAVLVTPEMFDELEEEREVARMVLRGLREVAAGELLDDDDVWSELDQLLAEEADDAGQVDQERS